MHQIPICNQEKNFDLEMELVPSSFSKTCETFNFHPYTHLIFSDHKMFAFASKPNKTTQKKFPYNEVHINKTQNKRNQMQSC